MSRDQQNQTFKASQDQNQGYYSNAQNSYANAQKDVGNYENQLGKYASGNPYVEGGQFQTDENKTTANTADALARSTGNMLQSQALRTGQNSAGGIAATEEMERQGGRDLSAEQSQLDAQRIGNQADYQGNVLKASAVPEQMESTLADQQGRLAQGDLNTQEEAAKTPSWIEDFSQGLMNAGTAFAGGAGASMCPAAGSLYLLAGGSEAPVETLKVGDLIQGIDGEPQIIEEIQFAPATILRIATESGEILRCSRVHAFALPLGGFVVAAHAMGKVVRTTEGNSRIVEISGDGVSTVFNVITDGSHTYRANGFWSLGVGEAERQVTMRQWDAIADQMAGVGNGSR
jgi:hypothetical protein